MFFPKRCLFSSNVYHVLGMPILHSIKNTNIIRSNIHIVCNLHGSVVVMMMTSSWILKFCSV